MAFGKTRDLSDYPKGGFTFFIESQKKTPAEEATRAVEGAVAQRQQEAVNQPTEQTVCITGTGSKYHRSGRHHLR